MNSLDVTGNIACNANDNTISDAHGTHRPRSDKAAQLTETSEYNVYEEVAVAVDVCKYRDFACSS